MAGAIDRPGRLSGSAVALPPAAAGERLRNPTSSAARPLPSQPIIGYEDIGLSQQSRASREAGQSALETIETLSDGPTVSLPTLAA